MKSPNALQLGPDTYKTPKGRGGRLWRFLGKIGAAPAAPEEAMRTVDCQDGPGYVPPTMTVLGRGEQGTVNKVQEGVAQRPPAIGEPGFFQGIQEAVLRSAVPPVLGNPRHQQGLRHQQ